MIVYIIDFMMLFDIVFEKNVIKNKGDRYELYKCGKNSI